MQIVSNDAQDMGPEVNADSSHISVFSQISLESNAAYGEAVNQDSIYRLYESIVPPSKESTTQSPHMEQSEENDYEIVD